MFPNVRLLVAATLASIVALICGFGMFAALRVSHEPLLRPLVTTAPPQPLADNAASKPLAFAPVEPFVRRFDIGGTDRSDAVDAFTRLPARGENFESPPAATPAAPEPGATAAKEQPVEVEVPKDEATLLNPAGEEPSANDEAPAATPATADEPAPQQPTEPLPATATAASPAKPGEQAVAANPSAITATDGETRKSEETPAKAQHARAVAKVHQIRRAANATVTQDQQSNFVTAPPAQQGQTAQTRPAKAGRRNVAAGKTDNTANGIGGPFVGAPSQ